MASSSKNTHVRSNSLNSMLHPITLRVDEELNKLRVLEASTASTSNSIYKSLSGLEDLFICAEDLLNLASTQQVISQHGHEKYFEELLDGSLKILDVCEVTRDILVQIIEQIKSIQSTLRRRKGDSSIQSSLNNFMSFRKKMKKDIKKLVTALKQVDTKCQAMDLDSESLAVICILRDVSSISITILVSLLQFLSMKPKSSKWSLVLNLIQQEKVACEEKLTGVNELEEVDVTLLSLCKSQANSEKMQSVQEKLEVLELSIEPLENSLESMIRRMIKTRTSILNILSL